MNEGEVDINTQIARLKNEIYNTKEEFRVLAGNYTKSVQQGKDTPKKKANYEKKKEELMARSRAQAERYKKLQAEKAGNKG